MFNTELYERDLDYAVAEIAQSGAFDGKTVLITGATGLIGSFLADALLRLNETRGANIGIVAAGRSREKVFARFPGVEADPHFRFAPYEAAAPLAFDCAPDYVVHAACAAHPLAYSRDPVGTMQANLLGTMNLLDLLRTHGVGRLVFLSSGETYGENPDLPDGFGEQDYGWIDPMNPRSCYPESKRAAETLCACYAAQHGVGALVSRLCHVYGPTLTASNSRADAQFLRKALAGEDIVMKSAGSQVRSYCYVADAARAILTLLERGEAGTAYNVANRKSTASIREYAQTLADVAGVNLTFDLPPEAERAGYTKITRAVLNPARLESLGWTAEYDLRKGLEQTYHCLKS